MISHVNHVFDVLYCELFNFVIISMLVNLLTFKILPWLLALSSVATKKRKEKIFIMYHFSLSCV